MVLTLLVWRPAGNRGITQIKIGAAEADSIGANECNGERRPAIRGGRADYSHAGNGHPRFVFRTMDHGSPCGI